MFRLPADKKADCTIAMSDTDLLALMTGKMNPQTVSTQSRGQFERIYFPLSVRNRSTFSRAVSAMNIQVMNNSNYGTWD